MDNRKRSSIVKSVIVFASMVFAFLMGTTNTVEASTVNVNMSTVTRATGVKNGTSFETFLAHLDVDGVDAFCVEPLIPISGESVSGYKGNPANGNLPRKTILALSIWKGVLGSSSEARFSAQAVVWETLEGSNKAVINHIDGISDSKLSENKKKLLDAITNYDLKPSFHKTKQKLVLGEEVEIKNTESKVNLKDFDKLAVNTANLKTRISGESLFVTATDVKQTEGVLSYRKSYQEGTPYIYNKTGEQAVATGKINDPNAFLMNFDIDTTGDIEIVKLDAVTGKPVPNTKFLVKFTGELAPKEQVVSTDKDGKAVIKDVPHNVKYDVTEIEVPVPYILASALGGKDNQTGTVTAGETITTTFKNDYAKAKVIVNKIGTESKNQMWNSNYTLAGNIFELREGTEDGKVVATATSDKDGRAEFEPVALKSKTDIYWVTESKASQGFLKTFKPRKVELNYKDNKTPVIEVETSGDNQEVVGETTILKQDAETGNETQGKATFEGAEYSFYHADGTPMKWTESFKPILLEGTKVEGTEEIKVVIDKTTNKAKIGHIALEKGVYWQETIAPEGYQIDPEKHIVDLEYKDENTAVITKDAVSKEKVIKFDFEAFKKVTSKNGSTQTGVNDVEFVFTPIEPTKGEEKTDITKAKDGEDGYISFLGNPYGNYRMVEKDAPEGYEKIEPLIFESSYDKEKDVYQFKVTEEGQDEPLKVVKVPAKDIHEGDNVIRLSKFYLFDDAVKPEPAEMESLFRTSLDKDSKEKIDKSILKANKEYQTIDVNKDQNLTEFLWNKVGKEKVNKELYYLTQFHKLDVHGNSEPVGEVKTTQKIEKEEFIMEIPFEYKAKTLKPDEKLVATQIVYHDKEMKKEYARHYNLENKKQTITGVEVGEPKIETLYLIKGNESAGEETKDSSAEKEETKETKETKDSSAKKEETTETEETKDSSAKKEETKDSTDRKEQVIDVGKDHSTIDYVYNEVLPSMVGNELFYVTQFNRVSEKNELIEVLDTVETTHKVEKEKFDFEIPFEYKANMIKPNEKIVATHIAYTDKEHKKEYAKHYDLKNEKQTIKGIETGKPSIETLFLVKNDGVANKKEETKDSSAKKEETKDSSAKKEETKDSSAKKEKGNNEQVQAIDITKDHSTIDYVYNEVTSSVVGKDLYYVTQFNKVNEKDELLEVLATVETTQKAEKEKFDFEIPFEYKANMIKPNEKIVATHISYLDKEHKQEYAKHYDLSNKKQTIIPLEMKQPKIETLFVTKKDEKQKINPFEDHSLVDKVHNELTPEVVGKELYYVTEFHRVNSKEESLGVLEKVESTQKVEKETFDFEVPFEYKKDSIKEGEKIVATHIVYLDKEHKQEYARHYDLSNEKQTIVAEPQTILKKTLPTTGEDVLNLFKYGVLGIAGLVTIQFVRERKRKKALASIESPIQEETKED